jgi:heat shock protein HslJ
VGGSYSASEGAISFSDVYLTKMFCEGSQEGEFVDVLHAAESYTFTEEGALVLVLAEDGGRAVFR